MPTQPVESAHHLFEVAIRRGYESDIHLRLSQQLQVQEADQPQEIEKTEEEGRKAACGFGENWRKLRFHQYSEKA